MRLGSGRASTAEAEVGDEHIEGSSQNATPSKSPAETMLRLRLLRAFIAQPSCGTSIVSEVGHAGDK